MEQIDRSKVLNIRGTEFLFEIKADASKLRVAAEERHSGKRWCGEFSNSYIEDITQKAGIFKKCQVFTKMLLTALEASSESVFVDLLTYQDLEMLKSRKGQRPPSSGSLNSANPKLISRRYLILTYAVEFDRVHYPLPLLLDELPDIQRLQRTIDRLNAELAVFQSNSEFSPSALLEENEELRQRVKTLEHQQNLAAVPSKSAVEIDSIVHDKKAIEEEYERARLEHSREFKKLKLENVELKGELEKLKDEMDGIIEHLENENEQRTQMKEINGKVKMLMEQLETSRGNQGKVKEAFEKAQNELDRLKQLDRKQKQRIKQLEDELQAALKNRSVRSNSIAKVATNPRSSSNPRLRSPATRSPATRSPATRSPATRSPATRSPATRSPATRSPANRANRLGTPPSRNVSPVRRTGNSKSSPSRFNPNAKSSPYNSSGRIGSSPNRSGSGARRNRFSASGSDLENEQKPSRKRSPKTGGFDMGAIDERLSKLQQLLKNARS